MPAVAPLCDTELQPFLDRLPSRPETRWFERARLAHVDIFGHPRSRSSFAFGPRGCHGAERIAQLTHEIARYLYTLDFRLGSEEAGGFNTANEAAADILAKISITRENQQFWMLLSGQTRFLLLLLLGRPRSLLKAPRRAG